MNLEQQNFFYWSNLIDHALSLTITRTGIRKFVQMVLDDLYIIQILNTNKTSVCC